MRVLKDYSFSVSLSVEAFTDKRISGAMIGTTRDSENRRIRKEYGFKANRGVSFEQTYVTPQSLLDALLEGRVFCHNFHTYRLRKDYTFGSGEKKNDNFTGANVIGVDIDRTDYESAEAFIDMLHLKPTLWYTSYSNMQVDEAGNSKGARFRLIYVFDERIRTPLYFRYCAWQLNRMIEQDTGEEIKDRCNLNCSQYFNGTNKDNPDVRLNYGITNFIYTLNDISVSESGYIDFLLHYCYYESTDWKRSLFIRYYLKELTGKEYEYNSKKGLFEAVSSSQSSSTTINGEMENDRTFEVSYSTDPSAYSFSTSTSTILQDWDRLSADDFKRCTQWNKTREQTKYIYRVEKEWDGRSYQSVDDDYFNLYFFTSTMQDGQGRRKTLYQRMCLRRLIDPSITKDEMVVNTLTDILRFFDNSDGVLNADFITRNVESSFNLTLDEIREAYSNTIDYLKKETRPHRGFIYKDTHTKEVTWQILDEVYNPSWSVADNLEHITQELKYPFSKSTIYDYLKERGIRTDTCKLTDEELYDMLDIEQSYRHNYTTLKQLNVKVADKRLRRIYRQKRNKLNP